MNDVKRREQANVTVARELGTSIVTGRYRPGETIPGEVELAITNDVSRSVIREALRTLAAKGLIESRRKAGTRVRARPEWNLLDPELLRWMFEGAPPLNFVRSLFQLRLIIEPAAAEIGALNRTSQQLSRMGHALETMSQHGLRSEIGQAADQQFHAILLEATGNELLLSLSGSIAAAVRWTTYFKHRTSRQPRDAIPQHRILFEAVAEGDGAKARQVTAALIQQALIDTESALAG